MRRFQPRDELVERGSAIDEMIVFVRGGRRRFRLGSGGGLRGRAAGQSLHQRAKAEFAEERDHALAVERGNSARVRIELHWRVGHNRHQFLALQRLFFPSDQFVAPARFDFVEVRVDVLDATVRLDQFGGCLLANSLDAGNVIGRIAFERFEIDQLTRLELVACFHRGFVVEDHRSGAGLRREHQHADAGTHQLQRVRVTGDDQRLNVAARAGLPRQCAEQIVRLVLFQSENRNAKRLHNLARALQLHAQIVAELRASAFVFREQLLAKTRTHVERCRDQVRLFVV